MNAETLGRLSELLGKATPGPHQARFIYRMIRAVRMHQTTLGLMLQSDDSRDFADAELWAESANNLPELLDLAREALESRQLIEDAPHGTQCPARPGACQIPKRPKQPCNCWKSKRPTREAGEREKV